MQSLPIMEPAPRVSSAVLDLDPRVESWDAARELHPKAFSEIRCRMVLEGCKWDPQVGDLATLASFPLVIPAVVARTVGRLAEQLALEASNAERALIEDTKSLSMLGLPRRVCRALVDSSDPTPAAARVIRFDFHPTSEGWRISEANADVPGGYTESSLFPRLMAQQFPGTRPAGDPAGELVEAIADSIGRGGLIGLVAATGYMEDHQIVAYLARRLARRDCEPIRAHPSQVTWTDGFALVTDPAGRTRRLDAILRFYQGEWLARWPARAGWPHFFRGGRTMVCNPGTALVIESKRFPLVWDRAGLELPTWRQLLPLSRDPLGALGRTSPGWVLKTAFCNTGDSVAFSDGADRPRWRRAAWSARLQPRSWVAQRRFETLSITTPRGAMFPCLGIYTINGRASGIFGRLAHGPLIDYGAAEVAVLVEGERPN